MASAQDVAEVLLGAIDAEVRFSLRIIGMEEVVLRVADFVATEGISSLFRYEVAVAIDASQLAKLEEATGAEGSFSVEKEGEPRMAVHGLVTTVRPDGGTVSDRQVRATVVLEPRLASLAYSGGFRVFQKKTARQIIEELTAPDRIELAWRLRPELPEREYRTQLDESDFTFIERLAADEGIHYFFEHDDEKTTLVFTNDVRGFKVLDEDAEIPFRDVSGAITGEHVRAIERLQAVATEAVEHRDYDFTQPRLSLVGRATTEDRRGSGPLRRERREYPGAFDNPDAEGTPRARRRLEALRSAAITFRGTAASHRLRAGRSFVLEGHRDKGFNRKLLVTSVAMQGSASGRGRLELVDGGHSVRGATSLLSFDAVPAERQVRPPRPPKPASRLQIARVVGPKEGDPYVDQFGRVKVQFMWDRDGKFDEHSSCWLRMMTPAAHGDEGFWTPHKVGSEVLVDFIDGDIDRPVVMGALYNGLERQPHKQPDEATKSTWKVRSIPGGEGFNEITFENKAGGEEIVTHAQRDRTAHVLRNDAETIGANQTTAVGANQTTTVGASRSAAIGADDTTTVGGSRHEVVDEKEDVLVKKGREHTVEAGSDVLHVPHDDREVNVYEGNHTRNVKLVDKTEADNVEVHARYDVHVTGDRKVEFRQGDTVATFEDGRVELHAAGSVLVHHNDTTIFIDDAGKLVVTAEPELEMNCGGAQVKMGQGKVSVEAPEELTLAVGQSALKLTPTGWEICGAQGKATGIAGPVEVSSILTKIN